MSNPNRRRRPVWCGDVDTTRPGAAWDVQDDGCCGPCKPAVPGCGPCRPPMPQFPDCGYHIPPVQYVPGMNEQEQLANLNCKMNELIELFNCNTDKVYGAYEEVVRSAVCNDAFYKEITVESGYLSDVSTSYELVHIPYVDCACQPIYMEMGLAYNNTTNSGVTESVFDKALEVYADKILPAAERGFQGVAIWKGAPIYSGETHVDTRALIPGQCDYTLGVTENGYFKIYDTPNDRDNTGMIKTMRQDKVRNSMGCAVIIRGGEYVVDENLADMELPCTVMAMNYKTKERFILAVGKDNVASDITPEMIANLLKKYDVDVAALTSWGQQSYLLDKGQFSFMPTSTDSDGIPTVPQSAAFWYITKRRNFHNDYVKEVAALTIQMGENLWYDELTSEAVDNLKLDFVDLRNDLEQEIQDRKDADDALGERIDKEIAERKAADTALDEKYAGEVARLDEEIDALEQRVTTEVTRLDALIQSTKEALTAKDVKEVKVTHDGTRDTYQVVLNDGTVLGADVIVYNYDQLVQKLDSYATVEQRLDAEIQARKDADDALNALITAEQQARANGDTALSEQIASVKAELTELIQGNTTDITALQGALDTLTQKVQSNYASLNERVTSNAENIANLQGSYGALQATVAALNETVTGLQQSFASTEQSFENVKQTVANMQTELNAFEERIEGELGNYLPLSGGTMTGPINMGNQAIRDASAIILNGDTTSPSPGDITGINELKFKPSGSGKVASGIYFTDSDQKINGVFELYSRRGNDRYSGVRAYGVILNNYNSGIASSAISEAYIRLDTPQDENTAVINFMAKVDNSAYGRVILNGIADPVTDYNAANKHYVDTVGENLAGEIAEVGGQLGNYLPLSGGVMTGEIAMNSNSISGIHQLMFTDSSSYTVSPSIVYVTKGLTDGEVFQFTSSGQSYHYASLQALGLLLNDQDENNLNYNLGYIDIAGRNNRNIIIRMSGRVRELDTDYSDVILRGILNPVAENDVANKAYVDGIAETVVRVRNLTLDEGIIESVNNFVVNEELVTGFGVSNNSTGDGTNITRDGVQVVSALSKREYSLGTFGPNLFSITGDNSGYSTRVSEPGLFISYNPSDNDSVPRIYGRAVQANQSILHAICFSEDGGFNPQDNFTRLIGIDDPVNAHDAATKGYVDAADEGFLCVDGGRLYAHGDTPQGVFLDKIDFASQGVEESGVATLSISGTTGNLVMSILDESLTHVPLRFGAGELTDGSAGVNMSVLEKYMRGGVSESVTSANVKATDMLTGLYIVRYVSEVYMVNVTGYELGDLVITSNKIMGTDDGITFTTEVVDVNTMKLTFSSDLESGFQVTKLTGGAYVEVSILS